MREVGPKRHDSVANVAADRDPCGTAMFTLRGLCHRPCRPQSIGPIHLRPPWHFLGSGVDVLKFASGLPAIVARMAEVMGVDQRASLPHVHRTADQGPEVRFDRIDRLRVQEFHGRDVEVFGDDPDDASGTLDR